MEMAYCSDKGMPHSEFLSWDPEDRAKQHAYLLEESSRCVLCGTQPWEWAENKHAYVTVEKFCQGCYNKNAASQDSDSLPGTTVDLVPHSADVIERQRIAHEKMMKSKAAEERERRERRLHSRPAG